MNKDKNMKTRVLTMIAVSLLVAISAGCATSVKTTGNYKGLINTDKSRAAIYVYRESAIAGMINQYDVLIDEKLVGSLPNGSFFVVNTDAGNKMIRADTGMGEGSKITVKSGDIYCMKLDLNFNVLMKSANISPVSKEQCEKEIRSLREVQL